MEINRRELLSTLIAENLWKRLSPEEVRLYLLLIISIDETKKIGKLKKRDMEKYLGYGLTVEQLEKIAHTFRELHLAEIEYSKEESEIKFELVGKESSDRTNYPNPS